MILTAPLRDPGKTAKWPKYRGLSAYQWQCQMVRIAGKVPDVGKAES